MWILLGLLAGMGLGWAVAWLRSQRLELNLRTQIATLDERVGQLQSQLSRAEIELAAAESAARAAELESCSLREKGLVLDEAHQKMSEVFKLLSADALKANNQSFIELARMSLEKVQLEAKVNIARSIQPIEESLKKFDHEVRQMEKARSGAYEGLREQLRGLSETQNQLREQTGGLLKALRLPSVRGRWGEIQLKRVVEMAGMIEHCDFTCQVHHQGEEGAMRPDMVIRLPSQKQIIVDAKAPLQAYLTALELTDEQERLVHLREHARQIRSHVSLLSKKSYWSQFQPTPEFVVLFLPGETFFSAALEQDPALIEEGVDQGIILATPTTLIALLRAVSYGWRQESLSQNAQMISDLGQELYKRLSDMATHFSKVGRGLTTAVQSYNQAVGSMESRVLVSARRFKELASTPEKWELPPLNPVDETPRSLEAPELK